MVITARVGTGLIKRILVDTGADSNIMFRNVFDALGLRDTDLATHQHGVVGLSDHFIKLDGIISLPTSVGQGQGRRTVMAEFVVLRDSTAYNIILGRKTINDLGAAISTKLLVMKFVTDDGSIGSIKGDLETAVACDHASLSLRKKSKEASGVFLADLDARINDKPRPEPEGDLEKFKVGDTEEKFTFINRNLPHGLKGPLMEMIRANADLFTWTPADMPGIDPQLMSHCLAVKPEAQPVAQRRRKMSQERAEEVARQTASLLEAGFIRELDYSTWLSNVVLVKKHNERWRMCVDYSDLNKASPKDCYPLPNIDALVDAVTGYRKADGVIPFSRRIGSKSPALFNLMKKGIAFEWTPACEKAFNHFKEILASPPMLGKPMAGEPLYFYLAVTEEALAAVLIREEGKAQQPIYFVSRAL
ncbi:uncharacterized protein [Arachis hypogaea]|uniref:uncharacterized protein n=1 Tax=Arachis hypogaea TaxID=3818 RepID=UPI003B213EF1